MKRYTPLFTSYTEDERKQEEWVKENLLTY